MTTTPFWIRRLHSLAGLGLALFLFEHLLTNSEAALPPGGDGHGFIRMVNFIHSLPYLPAIEIGLIGIPFVIHALWGIKYALSSEPNSYGGQNKRAKLSYGRNRAFTWQRLTSWILLIGVVLHVVQMRFIEYPAHANGEYMVKISLDNGLYTLASRLNIQLWDDNRISQAESRLTGNKLDPSEFTPDSTVLDGQLQWRLQKLQESERMSTYVEALRSKPIQEGEVIAVADSFGAAVLLTVRDTFKMPLMLVLYTIYVLAAVFHAYNGLWTFLISWGICMTPRSQAIAQKGCYGVMGLLALLGLASIWGTYWINLKY